MWWRIVDFFIQEHHYDDTIYGGEYYIRKTLKTGNLALVISIITLIIVLWKILI